MELPRLLAGLSLASRRFLSGNRQKVLPRVLAKEMILPGDHGLVVGKDLEVLLAAFDFDRDVVAYPSAPGRG
jgi:hypothetical protein